MDMDVKPNANLRFFLNVAIVFTIVSAGLEACQWLIADRIAWRMAFKALAISFIFLINLGLMCMVLRLIDFTNGELFLAKRMARFHAVIVLLCILTPLILILGDLDVLTGLFHGMNGAAFRYSPCRKLITSLQVVLWMYQLYVAKVSTAPTPVQ